jgi:hypothetical protein
MSRTHMDRANWCERCDFLQPPLRFYRQHFEVVQDAGSSPLCHNAPLLGCAYAVKAIKTCNQTFECIFRGDKWNQ